MIWTQVFFLQKSPTIPAAFWDSSCIDRHIHRQPHPWVATRSLFSFFHGFGFSNKIMSISLTCCPCCSCCWRLCDGSEQPRSIQFGFHCCFEPGPDMIFIEVDHFSKSTQPLLWLRTKTGMSLSSWSPSSSTHYHHAYHPHIRRALSSPILMSSLGREWIN